MTRVLYRISRSACPAVDRPWLDALFAEIDAIESGKARLLWIFGAVGLLLDRYVRRLDPRLMLAAVLCAGLSLASGVFWFTGYEGVTGEDDFYIMGAAIFASGLIALSAIQLTRPFMEGESS
jgi:hypothetical protein